ncbi:MAG: TIGR03086 family metal-binding protein [Acidimicrobiales bacterium]
MADFISLYRRSVEGFSARVDDVDASQWDDPTPCADWDVRTLVNHLVYEDKWAVPLLAGRTIAEIGDQFEGDLVGGDPKGVWAEASEGALAAVGDAHVLERTVHLSFGDTPGEDYLSQLICDHTIHAWDLARGTGGDEALDPELVEFALGYLGPRVDDWRAGGAFGPAVDVPADADPQTRLLGITGRRA